MSGKGSRTKGASAERELIKLLEDHLGDIVHQQNLSLQRNLEQTRSGGHDVIGLDDIAIEVKRQERLQLKAWWNQAVEQADDHVPVLAYRQSRRPWRFIVPMYFLCSERWQKEVWAHYIEFTPEISIDMFASIVRDRL